MNEQQPVRVERAPVSLKMVRGDHGTYWKEGALLLGIPAAIGTFVWLNHADSDAPQSSALPNALFVGLIAGAFGGLIGFFFPKE